MQCGKSQQSRRWLGCARWQLGNRCSRRKMRRRRKRRRYVYV
jgi:hypothetical protein